MAVNQALYCPHPTSLRWATFISGLRAGLRPVALRNAPAGAAQGEGIWCGAHRQTTIYSKKDVSKARPFCRSLQSLFCLLTESGDNHFRVPTATFDGPAVRHRSRLPGDMEMRAQSTSSETSCNTLPNFYRFVIAFLLRCDKLHGNMTALEGERQ